MQMQLLLLAFINRRLSKSTKSIKEQEDGRGVQKYLEEGVPVTLGGSLGRSRRQTRTRLSDLPSTTPGSPPRTLWFTGLLRVPGWGHREGSLQNSTIVQSWRKPQSEEAASEKCITRA